MTEQDPTNKPPIAARASPSPARVTPSPSKLKFAGVWSGTLELDLEATTLPGLKDELARRSGRSSDSIELISAGKVLRSESTVSSLAELGLKNNSKVLARAVSVDKGKELNDQTAAAAEKEKRMADHETRMTRIKNAAKALAERHTDGSFPLNDYNIELEDQSGQKVEFGSEVDKKSVMMGIMLHNNGRAFIKKQKYKEALDVLCMAEEAFSLCDSKFIEMIDNVPMLQLDIVWCYFMLRDVSCLTMAGVRLEKARKGFQRSHGEGLDRLRLLHGYQAETAIYVRLELLEGVVFYYSGNREESRKALSSAQTKYLQLQVSDEALSLLMSMGYSEKAAKRALKMTGQDIELAVEFLVEERAKRIKRRHENLQRQAEILEQMSYGKTPKNKVVDLQRLNNLVSIGFDRDLAAEALRINENDDQKALDLLTDPESNCVLQSQLEARKDRSQEKVGALTEELISMGYDRSSVSDAIRRSGTKDGALKILASLVSGSNEHAHSTQPPHIQAGPSSAPDSGVVAEQIEEENLRDEEMEDELARELKGDAMDDYNVEVTIEGEAIAEYLAYLDAAEIPRSR